MHRDSQVGKADNMEGQEVTPITQPSSNATPTTKPQLRHRGRCCRSQFLSLVRRSLTQLYDSVSVCVFKDSHKKRVRAETDADTCSFHDITGVYFSHKSLSSHTNQPRIFSYAELYIATHGFNDDQVLGCGGFGRVYKATLPSDASVVAVKCLLASQVQGNPYCIDKSFAAELVAVAHLRHRNLVPLRGWCLHDSHLLLVYDYMPNHSLDRVLFIKTNLLSFERRRHILHGLAAALFYLHEQLETQIIHRDVKTSNVMLDSHYNARLGDFGLARWLEHDLESLLNPNTDNKTPSMSMRDYDPAFRLAETTRIGGTIGYLPPESFRKRYVVTSKSDVFSFGVVVLEVASGRRAVDLTCSDDKIILLDWVRQLADKGNLLLATDPRLPLDGSYNLCDMGKIIHIGLLCTLHDPKSRPTMKWVLDALSGNILGKLPTLPPFKAYPPYISLATAQGSSSSSSSSNTVTSINSITGKFTTSMSSSTTSNSTIFITAAGKTIFLTAAEAGSDDNNYNSHKGDQNTRRVENPFPVVETPKEISYAEIVVATNSFSDYNRVAEIDFGTAYQGFLQDHRHILVKRLGMKTCPALRARFSTELQNVGRLRHRNLVQLRGWCTEQGEMLVVYDFLDNRLLSHLLFHNSHRQSKGRSVLQWHHRYNIIRSLASAILYMHEEWEEQVIHRNITSSSVVVEPDMNPRLTNFALAEFLTRNEHGHHIANDPNHNVVQGIFGYMSPEYMESGETNTAADIYSFGVVILEVISGQMAVDSRRPEVLLVKRVREFMGTSRPLEELADGQLDGVYDREELAGLMKLGLACTLSNPHLRPSMRQIVSILDGNYPGIMQGCTESIVEWRRRNADSLSMARRIQALGIH